MKLKKFIVSFFQRWSECTDVRNDSVYVVFVGWWD